ncbi:MAG: ABC transporter permease [Gemmatimonadales bacterium]
METLRQDIRFAWRTINRARGAMSVAALCLALGIGANTAIFSVVRAVLLQSLPYHEPDRLVNVRESYTSRGETHTGSVAPPNYFAIRDQVRELTGVAGYFPQTRDLGDVANPEHLQGQRATANLFEVLGARPLVGRTFVPADSEATAPLVVVLSEALWRRSFGGDPHAVGSSILMSNVEYRVIGVMPAGFDFPVQTVHNDFWTVIDWANIGGRASRRNHSLTLVARLAARADSASAARELAGIARTLAQDFPAAQTGRGFALTSVADNVVAKVRPALLVLLGAVALVLLIACANVANLLLARAAGRRRELAIRTALGAARGRLVRQLLTESAMLAAIGGILGLAIARLSLAALVRLAADTLPRAESIRLDATVAAFAVAVSIATGLLFGLAPAVRTTRTNLRDDLSDAAGRSSAGAARHRTLDLLIAAEIALSLILLVGAGLVVRSFVALLDTDAGFRAERVLSFHTTPPAGQFADSTRYAQFYGQLLARVRQLPDVRMAAFTSLLPIEDGPTDRYFGVVGRAVDSTNLPDAEMRVVSSAYFRTLGIPVLVGREFDDRDDALAAPVVIINDRMAAQFFPGQNPIGQRINGLDSRQFTIVGVVKAVRQMGLDQAARAELYLAAPQATNLFGPAAFVLSTRGDPDVLAPAIRRIMHDVAPRQPVYQLATMTTVVSRSLAGRRLVLVLLGAFAALALALAAAGVYGVMSYAVSQRTREIGIRMALGAQAWDVATMVLRSTGSVTATGMAAGLLGAALITRLMRGLVYGVSTYDPLTFVLVPAMIAAVAIAAGIVPAVRAARVDPLRAMRVE